MTNGPQLVIDFSAPPLARARAAGDEGMRRATERAERETPSFGERAEALILEKLRRAPASGEDCTDFCRDAGLQFADGRALGAIYSSLARRGWIEEVGTCLRRKGHSGAGGRVWALTDLGRQQPRDAAGRFA